MAVRLDGWRSRWREAPWTLRAITVAGVTAIAVAGGLAPRRCVRFRMPPDVMARTQLEALADAVDQYALERRALPPTLDGLTRRGGDGEPYLVRIPLDPWRRPYRYAVPVAGRRRFEVRSDGPDGRAGTDDDLVVRRRGRTPP